MTDEEQFDLAIMALEKEKGLKARLRAYQVFTEVSRWLCQCGHGNLTLSAFNSLLGEKLKTETIVNVNRKGSSDKPRE